MIREANENDLKQLIITKTELDKNVIDTLLSLSRDWENENICFGLCANELSDLEDKDIFIAKSDGQTVGYLMGYIKAMTEQIAPIKSGAKCFIVDELYVAKAYRSKGIGKALFEFVENYYSNDVEYITLSTATKDSKKILHFYIDELDMTFWSANLFKKL